MLQIPVSVQIQANLSIGATPIESVIKKMLARHADLQWLASEQLWNERLKCDGITVSFDTDLDLNVIKN